MDRVDTVAKDVYQQVQDQLTNRVQTSFTGLMFQLRALHAMKQHTHAQIDQINDIITQCASSEKLTPVQLLQASVVGYQDDLLKIMVNAITDMNAHGVSIKLPEIVIYMVSRHFVEFTDSTDSEEIRKQFFSLTNTATFQSQFYDDLVMRYGKTKIQFNIDNLKDNFMKDQDLID